MQAEVAMRIGIAKKLFILFSLFILIFYGTVAGLFIKVRAMSDTSARIVSLNNRISALSKNLLDNLVEMDVNDQKFRLLGKDLYYDGFETARQAYGRDLTAILTLVSGADSGALPWNRISRIYEEYTRFRPRRAGLTTIPPQGRWAEKDQVSQWMADIAAARRTNEQQIEQALIQINTQSRQIVNNGMIGFGISILAGLGGILFISRSMLSPLNKLKTGLTQISHDNYSHQIAIASNDEFEELAGAFNDMSRQLKADEDIRSDFIASLSHEIRTPLSSIRESVNMIIEEILGPVNPKQKKFLTIASREITRITSLLNHLLDTSMLGDGNREFTPRPMNPDRLVREALQSMAPTAALRQVDLVYSPLEDVPRVIGEEKEITQVLLNITGNALKFSPENGRVDVGVECGAGNEYLRFSISDQGPGIPPEKQGLIFKKYYRAEETRKNMDGVGLGLNIARQIILAHGGEIMVKNNDAQGCTFSFTLPVYKKSVPRNLSNEKV